MPLTDTDKATLCKLIIAELVGAGHIEPDPAVYPNAAEHIEEWLTGIDFFFRHVPGLRLMPTIVSGVVSP
ncbi:MAG: hypothetical protein WAU81_03065 [Candidatus Aminicenantales bacterium]